MKKKKDNTRIDINKTFHDRMGSYVSISQNSIEDLLRTDTSLSSLVMKLLYDYEEMTVTFEQYVAMKCIHFKHIDSSDTIVLKLKPNKKVKKIIKDSFIEIKEEKYAYSTSKSYLEIIRLLRCFNDKSGYIYNCDFKCRHKGFIIESRNLKYLDNHKITTNDDSYFYPDLFVSKSNDKNISESTRAINKLCNIKKKNQKFYRKCINNKKEFDKYLDSLLSHDRNEEVKRYIKEDKELYKLLHFNCIKKTFNLSGKKILNIHAYNYDNPERIIDIYSNAFIITESSIKGLYIGYNYMTKVLYIFDEYTELYKDDEYLTCQSCGKKFKKYSYEDYKKNMNNNKQICENCYEILNRGI